MEGKDEEKIRRKKYKKIFSYILLALIVLISFWLFGNSNLNNVNLYDLSFLVPEQKKSGTSHNRSYFKSSLFIFVVVLVGLFFSLTVFNEEHNLEEYIEDSI